MLVCQSWLLDDEDALGGGVADLDEIDTSVGHRELDRLSGVGLAADAAAVDVVDIHVAVLGALDNDLAVGPVDVHVVLVNIVDVEFSSFFFPFIIILYHLLCHLLIFFSAIKRL